MARRIAITIGVFGIGMLFVHPAHAQESVLDSKPIVGDAAELDAPSSSMFKVEPPPGPPTPTLREMLKEELKDIPAFFRDTTMKLNMRSFYFNRQDGADAPGNDKEKVSWALGGSAALQTGKLLDIFSIKGELFTSQKLYGPEDKDGALLLDTGQEGYTIIGVANPRFDYDGHALSLYRQRYELPYINSQDNRMTPNTFEAYSYAFVGEGATPPLQFALGYLDKIKKRNSDEFVHMSEGAGVEDGRERGMPFAGVRVRPAEDVKVVAVNYAGLDFLNFFYSDAEHLLRFCEDWSLKSAVQFSEQRSIGDDLLTDEDVSVAMWGVQEALSYRKFLVRTAVTVNDKGNTLQSPFGTYPGFNSSIVEDYNRAGEIAWKIGISYDFSGLGLDGVTAYSDYIQGNRAVTDDDPGAPRNDKDEIDFNVDYRIKEGFLNGIWLRVRTGFVHEETVGTTKDLRVILNYEIPIL